jgi:hypothetical protein
MQGICTYASAYAACKTKNSFKKISGISGILKDISSI